MSWKKVENEAGYPCYADEITKTQQYDHPEFSKIMETLEDYDGIKYNVYRIAFKIFALQRQLRVPPLRISSGVFARHQLSLSESSLSLETAELEAVLADIYFAAEKEGLFSGDVDLAVDLLINLLLNVYDKERKEPIRVLAAKTLLIILSEESASDKWVALSNSCADHNGCVSPRRLAALLTHVVALPLYLGTSFEHMQEDVDSCFDKSAGMLGVSAHTVSEWGVTRCGCTRWLSAVQRVADSRSQANNTGVCACCQNPLVQVLTFKCSKCREVYICEKCYLYNKDLSIIAGHKKTHLVLEIIDGQVKPRECKSFLKGMRRLFFCTKTKKRTTKKIANKKTEKLDGGTVRRKKDGRPNIFTSTVGKASGSNANNPAVMLQDIIVQLETKNKALIELSSQTQGTKESHGEGFRMQMEEYWNHISMQINRLKILKENLTLNQQTNPEPANSERTDRPQAFGLFSPILIEGKKPKVDEDLKNQPRVLSLDSGNFSVVSKHAESQKLLTMSSDAMKPIVVHATSDSISTVSMNDISGWYNETESQAEKRVHTSIMKQESTCPSLSATEQKYAADIRSVETSNDKMKEQTADLDTVVDRLQQILTNNFAMDDSCFDNAQLRETANEMEGLLGTLIRGVEERATLNAAKGLV